MANTRGGKAGWKAGKSSSVLKKGKPYLNAAGSLEIKSCVSLPLENEEDLDAHFEYLVSQVESLCVRPMVRMEVPTEGQIAAMLSGTSLESKSDDKGDDEGDDKSDDEGDESDEGA